MFDQADAARMVDEYTLVQRPMELWPVYRIIGTEGDQANVRVNSNIDNTRRRRRGPPSCDGENRKHPAGSTDLRGA